jgi:hypothetical protein
MNRKWFLVGGALALTSALALAQGSPESLLPPGFDDPAPAPAPQPRAAPAPGSRPAAASAASSAQSAPARTASAAGQTALPGEVPAASSASLRKFSLEELERLSPDELEEALDLKPKTDIPAAARRSMKQIGVLGRDEGGMPELSLVRQDRSLVRTLLVGNDGQLVSRWGHIVLRRALASRLDAPTGMRPADFAAERAALLVRMGEGVAARRLVQDIDSGNYTPRLSEAARDAYVATMDFTGLCPVLQIQGMGGKDGQWEAMGAICAAFRGEGNLAMSRLDRQLSRKDMARIDVLLAQKYAGAAGKARRAVKIEWDGVNEMTPWRYGLTLAVGLKPPEALMRSAGPRYAWLAASAPMLGLADRAAAADSAASAGILSSAAMVDLYSQMFADSNVSEQWTTRARKLREAYVAATPAARLAAMRTLWDEGEAGAASPAQHSRRVLTAFAAARMPVSEDLADAAPDLVASMLTAGLDRNALRWLPLAEEGSQTWALLVLAAPGNRAPVDPDGVETFYGDDDSEDARKSAFLLAGLAGLGRISPEGANSLAGKMDIDLKRQTRWTRAITRAADFNNMTLVALLAGLGMQGSDWSKMTPLYLYHIVSGLRQVGLEAEARMIAAEAVARG